MSTLTTAPRPRTFGEVIAAALITAGYSKGEQCRAQAAECRELANHSSGAIQRQYEELARQWLLVADYAQK
jgi:hypothetical protein